MPIEAATLMVKVGADTYQAELNLKKLGTQLEKTAQTSTRAAKSTAQMGAGLKDVNRWAGVAAGGIAGLAGAAGVGALVGFAGQLAGATVELAKIGDQATKLGGSFGELAGKAGTSGQAILQALRQASGGAITDVNLMLAANKAMLLGVADSAEEMAALMEVATTRGRAMGLSTTQAFDNLVTGLGRASPLLLDNLGITVDAESLYAEYAKTLGKTASALSEVEKKQALVNQVMAEATGEGGKIAAQASDWERLATAVANLRVEIGKDANALLSPVAGVAADAVQGVTDLMSKEVIRPTLDMEETRLQIEGLRMQLAPYNKLVESNIALTGEQAAAYAELQRQMSVAQRNFNVAEAQNTLPAGLMDGGVAAAVAAAAAAQERLAEAQAKGQAAAEEYAGALDAIKKQAGGLADALLGDLGPQVFGMVDEWSARWTEQFDILTEHGYTADEALKIIALDADRMGDALADAAGVGSTALDQLTRDAIELQGGLAGAALLASRLLSGGTRMGSFGAKGGGKGNPFTSLFNLGGAGNMGGYSAPKGVGVPGALGTRLADPFEKLADRMNNLGSSVDGAADAVSAFEGALGKIPGLFGTSEVTAEQMALAEAGVPQQFADDYIRQLSDEVLNGAEWGDKIDIKDAARRAGIDPNLPNEIILQLVKEAWDNSSFFANPANLELVNMDAAKAEIEKQQKSAEGEANLRALFGLGDEDTVAAVAGLGLDVQSGLADWLKLNGLPDAGLATATALGTGVKDNAGELGGGVTLGLFSWASSKEGDDALKSVGEELAKRVSSAMKVSPTLTLPGGLPATPGGAVLPSGGLGGAAAGGGTGPLLPPGVRGGETAAASAAAAPVVVNYNGPASPHEVELLARRVARVMQSRR